MSLQFQLEDARALARPPFGAASVRRLNRYIPRVRARIEPLATAHPWFSDLALSFPALLLALALPRPGLDVARAKRLVLSGAPLEAVAQAAEVPLWLRKFPPEAFSAPLPPLPDNADLRLCLPNHTPNWRVASRWLQLLSEACEAGDDDFVVWVAREAPHKQMAARRRSWRLSQNSIRRLALWAWFSQRPGVRANALARVKWSRGIGWEAATVACDQWQDAVRNELRLGVNGIGDVWLEPGVVDGFTFSPLRTAHDLEAEGQAMKNCVADFGDALACNRLRLWSVAKDGVRVATLSIHPDPAGAPAPSIQQLAGPKNAKAEADVWLAARRWLFSQDGAVASREHFKESKGDEDATTWRVLWRPYWLARRRIPTWLPLAPSAPEAVYF